jgi:hypothetical protein
LGDDSQTELKSGTAEALQKAVPGLSDELIEEMKVSPLRQFDPNLIQDPLVYRLYEVCPCSLPHHVIDNDNKQCKVAFLVLEILLSRFDTDVLPLVQAVMHYGESIKAIANEVDSV